MTAPDFSPSPSAPFHEDVARPRLKGRIKCHPEDFLVEELPAYRPSGSGEHLYLWIEKRDVPGELLLRHLSRTLNVRQSDIGSAGIKDRRAITRQWVSVPASAEGNLTAIDTDAIRLLEHQRHGNKLRSGHLVGNRFRILVRDVELASPPAESGINLSYDILQQHVDAIRRQGFPNFFGGQRFGRAGDTLALGLDLLSGRKTPRDIPYARRRFLLKLSLSAAQSDLFNQALTRRRQAGLLHQVLAGDVMEVCESGGKFVTEDPQTDQARYEQGEIAITGPIFGHKMRWPTGVPAEHEQALLAASGLTIEAFRGFGDLTIGTRRPYVIRPGELAVEAVPEGVWFTFTLPAGVYATTLLEQLVDVREDIERGQGDPPAAVADEEDAGEEQA